VAAKVGASYEGISLAGASLRRDPFDGLPLFRADSALSRSGCSVITVDIRRTTENLSNGSEHECAHIIPVRAPSEARTPARVTSSLAARYAGRLTSGRQSCMEMQACAPGLLHPLLDRRTC
jgi:hypothetical protein